MNIFNNISLDYKKLDFFKKIIGLNIIVFIIYKLSFLFSFQTTFLRFFSLENNFFEKPWSIITYSFIHHV